MSDLSICKTWYRAALYSCIATVCVITHSPTQVYKTKLISMIEIDSVQWHINQCWLTQEYLVLTINLSFIVMKFNEADATFIRRDCNWIKKSKGASKMWEHIKHVSILGMITCKSRLLYLFFSVCLSYIFIPYFEAGLSKFKLVLAQK